MQARVSEWYGDALRQLESDLQLELNETNCPWLDQEQCVVQSIGMVLQEASCPEGCENCSKPYCHCVDCGEAGVPLSVDGLCGECLKREEGRL